MSDDESLSPLWDDLLKDHEAETPLGEVALFRGYVTPDQLEECLQEQEQLTEAGTPRPIGEVLFSKSYLNLKQFAEVLRVKRIRVHYCEPCHEIYDSSRHNSQVTIRCHQCGDDAKSVGDGDLPVSQVDVAIVSGEGIPSGSKIGKYQIRKKIGEGGMGVIYEAEDPDLERTVALKVFKGQVSNRKGVSRLHREAALAARLRHPNIIAVHEVATCTLASGDPMHYISMDYIEGLTLGRYQKKNRDLPLRERLMILEKVSRAIHYAHTRGVVHRDLKPENILIDSKGTPIVMDFGLAKDIEGLTKLTISGAVMGTPMYMSPEQAGGKTREISPLTDVYALGVMMYEIITDGQMPFDADTPAAIYKKILEEDPPHPRTKKKNIHGDLSVICLKALEKKQADRYESALAFAEDLARFLAGDPIEARSPGMVTRIGRKVAKRKAIFGVGAAGVLVVSAVLGFMIPTLLAERSRTLEEERKRAAAEEARLSLLGEKTNTLLSAMFKLRRAGSTEGVDEYGEAVKKACDEVISEFPNLAEPHYILGRMYRAGMNPEEALREQNLAIEINPRYTSAHYERVILEIQAYQEALREATGANRSIRLLRQEIRLKAERPETSAEEFKAPLSVALEEKKSSLQKRLGTLEELVRANPTSVSEGRISSARGLWLWINNDLEGAREALLSAVYSKEPLEEAYEALATLEMESGNFEKSIRWWTEGIKVDKGYIPHLEGRGFTYVIWAEKPSSPINTPEEALRLAIDDFSSVLSHRPSSQTRLGRGQANVYLAFLLDQENRFNSGISDLNQVCKESPEWIAAWISRAVAFRKLLRNNRLKEESYFRIVLADLARAFELEPDRIDLRLFRGKLLYDVAQSEGPRIPAWILNLDRETLFGESLNDFRKVIHQHKDVVQAWFYKGMCLTQYGKYLKNDGRNPMPLWNEALKDFSEAIKLRPNYSDGFIRRAGVLTHIAEYWVKKKRGDPLPFWTNAMKDFSRGIKLQPREYRGYWLRGWSFKGRGEYKASQGRDSRGDFQKALADWNKTISLEPWMEGELSKRMDALREKLRKSPE